MNRTLTKISLIALSSLMLISCSNNNGNVNNNSLNSQSVPAENSTELTQVTYSNLKDSKTLKLAEELLANAGAERKRIDIFLKEVEKFNNSVDESSLTEGFETAGSTETKYDPYEMQDKLTSDDPEYIGYNCRITALSLFGDNVESSPEENLDTSTLVFDLASLEQDDTPLQSNEDKTNLKALYSTVPTELNKDTAFQAENFKKEWAKRKVSFKNNSNMKLISVVFNDHFDENEDELFVGHAGILLPQQDGTIYFLEKVSFQEPYRLNKFSNRKELHNYLMEKYDTSYNQPTAKPFIMENDEIMNVE